MLRMRQATRDIPLGGLSNGVDLSSVFSWATDNQTVPNVTSTISYPEATSGGFNWGQLASNIAGATANVTRTLSPILMAQNLNPNQSAVFNPATGQYVISSSSLQLSLTATGTGANLLSGWLPILGIGVVAVLGLSLISRR